MSFPIAHMVYFTLVDDSQEQVDALLAQCRKYLTNHPGVEFFAVGQLNTELSRPINDKGFHVSLHMVFSDQAAHDAYQIHPRHREFIDKNNENWKLVRIFDSNLRVD